MNEKIILPVSNESASIKAKTNLLARKGVFTPKGANSGLALEKKQRINGNAPVQPKIISIGDYCELKVTALGPKGIGIDEFTYGFSILIPKAQLGDTVKAQIKRIFNFKKTKYAVARMMPGPSVLQSKNHTPGLPEGNGKLNTKQNLSVGDILTVKLDHIVQQSDSSCIGQVNLVNSDLLSTKSIMIPLDPQKHKSAFIATQAGQKIQIQVTKIKLKYAFAKIVFTREPKAPNSGILTPKGTQKSFVRNDKMLIKGSKITLTLPIAQKPELLRTKYAKHIVILLSQENQKDKVLFLTNLLGAKQGDKVRVKFSKIGSTFAIGKILRIAPNSSIKKIARARKNINEMLANGMHYGEKVVKCQARMRSYIWKSPLRISSESKSESEGGLKILKARSAPFEKKGSSPNRYASLPKEAGGGQKVSNLKSAKKGRHLINLLKTRRCLNIGLNQLTKYAAKGRTFLFVGTKKPAAGLVARAALFSKTSFFVNTRWLGGMLTNWKTIIKSIAKIRPILKEKQKVISNILQKRAIIQNRLIKKVLSLRKKARILIKKGKQLIEKVKNSSSSNSASKKNADPLLLKRKELFERGQFLLQKRQSLLNKQNAFKVLALQIKESGFLIDQKDNKYKVLLTKLTATHKKLHDIRLLFLLNKELRNITKLAKEQGKNQYTLSYGKFKQLSSLASQTKLFSGEVSLLKMSSKKLWLIPNPPQQILKKILFVVSPRLTRSDSLNFSVKEKNNTSPTQLVLPSQNFEGQKQKSIILTKLLSKFSRFLPYIKNAINSMLRLMLGMVKKMAELKTHLKNLKTKLVPLIKGLAFKTKITAELKIIQKKYTSEQQIIRVLRRKLKRHEAEKKLLQFLPKLRYLPTPKNQIAFAIQILMKRFVDPKMKYPMDLIYDEKLRKKSKKVAAARKKKWQRLETYFGGIANMTKLKKTQISNNVAIIIGQQEEMNACLECKKLGIKMFHIVDTNCNPGLADHFIPSNDDSRNSIKYLLTKIVTRIRLAQKIRLRFKVLSKK